MRSNANLSAAQTQKGRRDQRGALYRRHVGAAHHLHGGHARDHAGVKVDLPQAESEQLPEDSKPPFIVSVNTEGEYVIKAGEADDEPVPSGTPEAMQQYITEKAMGYLAINQNAPVVVAGDKSVRYEEVILLMVALKKAGVPQVGLMTDPVN